MRPISSSSGRTVDQGGRREALSRGAGAGRSTPDSVRVPLDRHLSRGPDLCGHRARSTGRTDGLPGGFPDLSCTNKVYEIDRDHVWTCSGGTAAMDLMLHLIADRYGDDLAKRGRQQFLPSGFATNGMSSGRAAPGATRPARLGCNGDRAMQLHIDNPIPLPEIGRRVGLGARDSSKAVLAPKAACPCCVTTCSWAGARAGAPALL